MNKTVWMALLVLLLISGCTNSTFFVKKGTNTFNPTNPRTISISHLPKLTHGKYVILGRVAVIVMGNGENARKRLQEEAARLGANAIIDFEIQNGAMRSAASGLAIIVQ